MMEMKKEKVPEDEGAYEGLLMGVLMCAALRPAHSRIPVLSGLLDLSTVAPFEFLLCLEVEGKGILDYAP